MTTLSNAIDQMLAAGMPAFPPGHPQVNTGKIIRYGPKKKAWYRLHEFRSNVSGQYVVGGSFGSWGEIPPTQIEIDWKGIAAEERERMQAERKALQEKEDAKRRERAGNAAGRAVAQWKSGRAEKPKDIETYLDRKGVTTVKGIRFFKDGTVLVPMIRYDVKEEDESKPDYKGPRRLLGLQKIAPDGNKLFNKGMSKEGAACRLGNAPRNAADLIIIVEGIATGLSIAMAIENAFPVYVVFDAGNILPAAKILRKLYPANPFLFCADDDAYIRSSLNKRLRENHRLQELVSPTFTDHVFKGEIKDSEKWVPAELTITMEELAADDGIPTIVGAVMAGGRTFKYVIENAGRKFAARAAAEVTNATVLYPIFADRKLPIEPDIAKLTDFNDLHKVEGLEAVRRQLKHELDRFAMSLEIARQVKEAIGKRKGKGKGHDTEPPPPGGGPRDEFWPKFYRRFTLIYPTQTAWDEDLDEIVKVADVRLNFGERVIEWWLRSDHRRTVLAKDVVFDPSEKCDLKTSINLFRGMNFKPKKGKCDLIIEALEYLCGEEGAAEKPFSKHVLKWIAYPLQHPGAKMQTAMVMYGGEGTGKNMFWSVVLQIYGRYGKLINQFQLQTQFNDWISRAMFVVANEVVTSMERRHMVGYLKNLVTERRVPIETKGMPVREEDNRMQLVFLSNEFQPLYISPFDRRYMVIKTPAGKELDYYKALEAEINAGGAAAFYRYLLDLDLGEFNEHTRPLQTHGKDLVSALSMDSPELFQRDLHENLLDVPYCPAEGNDLYRVYRTYCDRNGILRPSPKEMFSQKFMSMNGVSRQRGVRVPETLSDWSGPPDKWPQRVVFYMGKRPDGMDEKGWLLDGVRRFREAAKVYCRDKWGSSGKSGDSGNGEPPEERGSRRGQADDNCF